MIKPLVVIEGVTKKFPKQKKPALSQVSAIVESGTFTCIVGPDGAGKTTLMRLMAGLLKPDCGAITVANIDSINDVHLLHSQIGYMPQRFGLYENLSVQENLNLYANLRGLNLQEREGVFMQLLDLTKLRPFTKRFVKHLSGGMKQKLGLACALIRTPKLLLLDEPSVGVDPISRRELWDMVQGLIKEGVSVIWSTNYFDEAKRADKVILLQEGVCTFAGHPAGFKFDDAFLAEKPRKIAQDQKVVIECKNLSKHFDDFVAVNNFDLTIRQGEIFCLLGPNGAGKSTIFKMLCGLLRPTRGKANVIGVDLFKASSAARERIGYMAQKFSLYGDLSVQQNLDFFSGVYGLSDAQKKHTINEVIEKFKLQHLLSVSTDKLALGFQQRLALACAIMHKPAILFLDEPTSGVDPATRREFWHYIRELATKDVTVMVTTHFMDEVAYCDRVALIYQGKKIAEGSITELKDIVKNANMPNPSMEDIFIELIKNHETLY